MKNKKIINRVGRELKGPKKTLEWVKDSKLETPIDKARRSGITWLKICKGQLLLVQDAVVAALSANEIMMKELQEGAFDMKEFEKKTTKEELSPLDEGKG